MRKLPPPIQAIPSVSVEGTIARGSSSAAVGAPSPERGDGGVHPSRAMRSRGARTPAGGSAVRAFEGRGGACPQPPRLARGSTAHAHAPAARARDRPDGGGHHVARNDERPP